MNVVIGRLILFVNTVIKHDVNYNIAMFIIQRYPNIDDLSVKMITDECFVSRASIHRFCDLFGFHSWLDFQNELIKSKNVKMNQLKSNYTLTYQQNYYQRINEIYHDDHHIKNMIQDLSQKIKESQRIFLFGAIYPLSLCVEFQTNMISIGKKVYVDYNSLENIPYDFNENDITIILSASGRYIRECSKKFHQIYFSPSSKVLLTLTDQFETLDKIDYYIQFPRTPQIYDYNFLVMYFLELLFCECFLNE